MAYLRGIEPAEANWFTRVVYWFIRRQIGKATGKDRLIQPAKIAAHHPRILRAMGQMEAGLSAAHSISAPLRQLATLHTAMLVGCPF